MTKVRVSDAEHNFLVVVNGCLKVRKILRGFAREGVEVIVTYHLVYIGWKDFLCPSVKTKTRNRQRNMQQTLHYRV